MKKIVKIICSLVALVIIACLVLGVVFVTMVDVNRFKGQISNWVHAKTGRDLVIAGDIERSFFPWIGLKIHDVRLSNAKGFEPQNFISVGEADVRVKFASLIKGQIEIGKLAFKDSVLNLTKDAGGYGNWQDLTGRNRSPVALAAAPNVIKSELDSQKHAWKVSLANIEVSNATINWHNLKDQQQIQISNLHVKSKNIAEKTKFPLAIEFNLVSNKPKISGKFSINSNVLVDLDQQTYQLNDLKFVGLFPDMPKFEFYATDVLANLRQYSLTMPKIRLSYGDMKANANLHMTQLLGRPLFNGDFYTSNFNLKSLLNELGVKITTQDGNALQHVMINTTFNGTADKLFLNPLTINVDGSDINGYLNLGKSISFALKAQQFNGDRYLPATTPSSSAVPPPAQTPATMVTGAAIASPDSQFAALRNINVNGSLQIGELTVMKTSLKNFYTQLFINKGGVVQLSPLTADIYQGKTRGQVVMDVRGAIPRYSIDEVLSNVQINELTKSDRLTGRGNIEAHLGMQGTEQNSLLASLDGSLKFNIQNGALLGIDIPYQINRVLALVRKEQVPAQSAANKTEFGIFSGSGIFNHGVFTNNDLLMQSNAFKLNGSGSINLLSQAINYRVRVVGLNQQTDAQGNIIPEERQLQIPLLITGTISKPLITPDLQAIAGTLFKEKIQDKIEQFKEGRGVQQEELKRKAGKLLQRFLH